MTAFISWHTFWLLRHFWIVPNAPNKAGVGDSWHYLTPCGEIILSLLFLIDRFRVAALYTTIIVSITFVLYIICCYLFTHRMFWPYHALWKNPTWMQMMLLSLGWSWLALIAILLNAMRNMPANTSEFRATDSLNP